MVGDLQGTVRIWDVEQRRTIVQTVGKDGIRSVRYSPDGEVIAIGTRAGVEFRDAESLDLLASYGENSFSVDVAISPDSKLLAWARGYRIDLLRTGWPESPELTLWKTLEGEPVSNVEFLPDGKTLATTNSNGSVTLWNLESGRDVVSVSAHGSSYATGLAASRDGNILVSSGADNSIRIWRASK
ncbi:MAG: hypothetical protein R3C28_31630 [Pirellulaceae bacterium]